MASIDPSLVGLSTEQLTWLQAVYELERTNQNYSYIELRSRLRDQLPKDFQSKSIDSRILAGTRLTLLGVAIVDSKSEFLSMTDSVVALIAKGLMEDKKAIFRATELAAIIDPEPRKVARVLHYLGELGHFYESASGSGVPAELDSISIGSEECINEYYAYPGLDVLLHRIVDRITRSHSTQPLVQMEDMKPTVSHSFVPDTAFILMSMDPGKPELDDVRNAIKDVCRQFNIDAARVDEIQHSGVITELILSQIQMSEFLIADVSWERPNVYYEIGFAHALGKRPIIFRRSGTQLHFDLSVHNIPEYRNVTELKEMLGKRLEAITGRMRR
jgi:hypothetical protein